MAIHRVALAFASLLLACGPAVVVDQASSADGSGTGSTTGSLTATSTGAEGSGAVEAEIGHGELDLSVPTAGTPLDVLFVIDNSGDMGASQARLAAAMASFVDRLAEGEPRSFHFMVTTTDVGNPLCTPFQKPGYAPAMGAPISTGCNARIDRFTGTDGSVSDACAASCPIDVEPADAFVAYDTELGITNVAGGDRGSVAAALACLLPQGIDGCGYESPLEAMLLALSPTAAWNGGPDPFLRADADLAIVVLTSESDCSVANPAMLIEQQYWSVDPDTATASPSSAMCWTAGVSCTAADAGGVYESCEVVSDGPLFPVDRYTDFLASLRGQGKRVTMQTLAGVPIVLDYAASAPFEPIAGGYADLVYRGWQPDDLTPDELADGESVADATFRYGIGPACPDPGGSTPGIRALPSPRLFEVCRSLDVDGQIACCLDSLCGDHATALGCLSGVSSP